MEDETLESDIFTLMVFLKMLFASLLDNINSCYVCKMLLQNYFNKNMRNCIQIIGIKVIVPINDRLKMILKKNIKIIRKFKIINYKLIDTFWI